MKNPAASVHGRLLHMARTTKQDVGALLGRYGVERLLYRLAASPHAGRFVLKGAQLLMVYVGEPHRPTRDIDLLGFGNDDADELSQVFRDICQTPVVDDGLTFDAATVTARTIRENARYGGVQLRLVAYLGRARIPLQADVGFGDVVTPPPEPVTFPTLLDAPAPTLRGYPLATVVAEKLESLISLGLATSRMKDLYDLWYILKAFSIAKEELRRAIHRTFDRRGTPLDFANAACSPAPSGMTPRSGHSGTPSGNEPSSRLRA